ncbi:hypothetical protein [Pseudomonas xionganensis]|uniref:Uncharacterized protein n=1 Tax=Pseudomonas xionganensis TaxID=2654845 RepID=A0A6I4KUI5_9PSED|nr:hypothetical protein [Pseudomonas xionganensis]MVW75351.1 hypothetical protein [Pseudomonas xionganensis]
MSEVEISPEDEARYMEIMAAYDEAMRREAERISKRRAADHHTNCRDCGKFTGKARWVLKDSALAKERNHRPLCESCFDEYDDNFY